MKDGKPRFFEAIVFNEVKSASLLPCTSKVSIFVLNVTLAVSVCVTHI